MPRKGYIAKREVLPDPLYNSKIVTKLINNIMLDGKKTVAQSIVYDAFEMIKEKENKNALEVFEAALENVMPVLEVKARRVGRSNVSSAIGNSSRKKTNIGSKMASNLC